MNEYPLLLLISHFSNQFLLQPPQNRVTSADVEVCASACALSFDLVICLCSRELFQGIQAPPLVHTQFHH